MIKIDLEKSSLGMWTASLVDGVDVIYQYRHMDRGEAILEILAHAGIEVVQHGTHWSEGRASKWSVTNMPGAGTKYADAQY